MERPAFGGGTEVTEHFYNAAGQLVRTVAPGQADTLTEYDDLGRPWRSGLDLDGNGALLPASADRLEESETGFVFVSGAWWEETARRVYPADGAATAVTLTAQRTRLTGLGAGGLASEAVSLDVHGNATVATVTIDRAAQTEVRATAFPDAAIPAVETSVAGLLASSQSKTGVVITFGYDALGRRTAVTDPRTGTTTTACNALGQVAWVEAPAGSRTAYTHGERHRDDDSGTRAFLPRAATPERRPRSS